ncbi:MAG: hypothetical protein IPJ45_13385 [Ignavibacteria bacterium]|nr:hypothetical protein [Ignavibacteria bacterium]
MADVFFNLAPTLNLNSTLRKIIKNKIYKNENSILRNSFDSKFGILIPSPAVTNLQSRSNFGGYIFKETRIPSLLLQEMSFPDTSVNFEDFI